MSRISNRTIILGFAFLAAISLTYGVLNFHKALPEIGIDFQVSRSDALQNAREFLASRKFDVTDYKENIYFGGSGGDKIYLERELGVERLTSLAEDSLDLWSWSVRFVKPLQKLSYRVGVDPKGRICSFRRELEEEAAGPRLDTLAAQTLAEAFAGGPMSVDLTKWSLVETDVKERPNRRDYTFTYELNDFKAKEATYRMAIGVQGAEVASFDRFLREPYDWWRDWDKQRAQNELFQNIADILAFLTVIGVFIYFFKHVKLNRVPWKIALILGGTLAGVNIVMGLNSIPLAFSGYSTTATYGSFLTSQIMLTIVSALLQGILLLMLLGAGERLYAEDHPDKLSISKLFTKRGMKSREFFQATVMGYLLCAFDVGLVVLIYVLGRKIGFWSPADIKYSETLSTALPWIYPLAISMGASLLEEFWFRLFGISLFKRLTKSTALAIIIPALIWGFLHSNYPQQPGFARGLEVGLVGIIAGVVMLRFGIWATLVYHYLFDAVMIGLMLFRSDNLYFWISGLIVCGMLLVPAVVAGVIYLRKRNFEEVDDLIGVADQPPPPAARAPDIALPVDYRESPPLPHSTGMNRWALILGVAGILIALIPGPRYYADDFKIEISSTDALQRAKISLETAYSVDLSQHKSAVEATSSKERKFIEADRSDHILSYIKRYGTLDDAERLTLNPDGPFRYRWEVMFQKEFDPTVYYAYVTMDGLKVQNYIELADSAAGADIDGDSARAIAERAFRDADPEPDRFKLIEERSLKRPNRRDWTFVWETKEPVLKEATIRRTIFLRGDQPVVMARWVKIPEDWTRLEEERTTGETILLALVGFAMLGLLGWIVIAFSKAVKRGELEWRTGLIPAGIAFGAILISYLNQLPTFWFDYNNSQPVANFISGEAMALATEAALVTGITLLAVVLASALASGAAGRKTSLLGGDGSPGSLRRDIVAAIGFIGLTVGVEWLLDGATGWFNLPEHRWIGVLSGSINLKLPLLDGITGGLGAATLAAPLFFAIYFLITGAAKKLWMQVGIVLLFALAITAIVMSFGGALTTGESLWLFVMAAIMGGIYYIALKHLFGTSIRALAIGILGSEMLDTGAKLADIGGAPYGWQGIALIILMATTLAGLYLWDGRRRSD